MSVNFVLLLYAYAAYAYFQGEIFLTKINKIKMPMPMSIPVSMPMAYAAVL